MKSRKYGVGGAVILIRGQVIISTQNGKPVLRILFVSVMHLAVIRERDFIAITNIDNHYHGAEINGSWAVWIFFS